MKDEIIGLLDIKPGLFYIDCTFGEGGHSRAILERGGIVLGIDRDADTKKYADVLLSQFSDRFLWVNDSFSNIEKIWEANFAPIKVDGVLFDLGFSSNQIEDERRGFSFLYDSNLDMRYDKTEGETALSFLNRASFQELSDVILKYGEEFHANRIARLICEYRREKEIRSCFELLNLLRPALKNCGNKHFATKLFQALRIHVNSELDHVERGVKSSLKILRYYGKVVVLTFHSLEDRLIKNIFKNHEIALPSESEVLNNPRARSAKLRWFVEKENND